MLILEWQSSKVRNNSQGISCSVMGAKKVNLHANCDMQNCDGGSSTNAGTADDGTQVVMTGFQVASNLPNVRNWVEIIADGGTYYIAESKLACEQGE